MATYTIVAKDDHTGFHVTVVGGNGARQTLLGFATRADARAWIAWDERLSAAEEHLVRHEPGEGAG